MSYERLAGVSSPSYRLRAGEGYAHGSHKVRLTLDGTPPKSSSFQGDSPLNVVDFVQ